MINSEQSCFTVVQLKSRRGRFINSHSPVCSLPPEILSWIFQLGQAGERAKSDADEEDHDDYGNDDEYDDDVDERNISSFEVTVSHVNSHFRNVALGTRKLWRSIDVTHGVHRDLIATYISRSDGCGLWVRLDFGEEAPSADDLAKFEVILPHSPRYQRLIIDIITEEIDNPIIRQFHDLDTPMLEQLSISVKEVEGNATAIPGVHVLTRGAEKLSFVRLRGLAMSFFRPPLQTVTTLHLDQTLPLPIQLATLVQILSASPFLANLSIYGDMVSDLAWPNHCAHSVELPSLRSLRICGVSGKIYSHLLMGINAPSLHSLVLKDAQEFDLEIFWASPNVLKFPQLHQLTFCDFEFSSHVYAKVFHAFPTITKFSTSYSSTTPKILWLLSQPKVDIPWPNLHTLVLLLNLKDVDLIAQVIRNRNAAGHPLARLHLGTSLHLSAVQQYAWLQENVTLERIQRLEYWPPGAFYPDDDDTLFY